VKESNSEVLQVGPISRLIEPTRLGQEEARELLLKSLRPYLQMVAADNLDVRLRQKAGVSDIVQLSFLKIIDKFDSFRGESSNELKAWIRTIVKREIGDLRSSYHAAKRNVVREESPSADRDRSLADPMLTPSSDALQKEQNARVREVLESLAPDDATVINLRNFESLSFREIGERMNRSEQAASQLWYRAILRFEQKFRELE